MTYDIDATSLFLVYIKCSLKWKEDSYVYTQRKDSRLTVSGPIGSPTPHKLSRKDNRMVEDSLTPRASRDTVFWDTGVVATQHSPDPTSQELQRLFSTPDDLAQALLRYQYPGTRIAHSY